MRLKDMATVKTGLVMARKQARNPSEIVKKYKQLNLRAIRPNGYIDNAFLEEFPAAELLKAEYLTWPGDVIVRLTTPYTAVLISKDQSGLVIPSHFVVIRPDVKKILAEYLYWLLNTDKIKAKLQQNTSSTMIGTVKPKLYANLDIELISLANQRKIAELNLLAKKEQELLEELIEQKGMYYKEAINKIQREMRKKSYENNEI